MQRLGPRGLLAFGAKGHAAREIGQQRAAVVGVHGEVERLLARVAGGLDGGHRGRSWQGGRLECPTLGTPKIRNNYKDVE